MSNQLVIARLDLIAAKAKMLTEQYKNNQISDTELESGLSDVITEISKIFSDSRPVARVNRGGTWFPTDK